MLTIHITVYSETSLIQTPMGQKSRNCPLQRGVLVSEVEMYASVVLGVGKGVLFREASSVQECPHRERERGSTVSASSTHTHVHIKLCV